MKHLLQKVLILAGLLLLTLGGINGAQAGTVAEVENNYSFGMAQNLDGLFDLTANANIVSSTSVPHATVLSTTAATSEVEYYDLTVPERSATAYFDITVVTLMIVIAYISYIYLTAYKIN